MEMIDAYVSAVGRHLPEKQRADIEREIHSMIEDTLEDESTRQGRPSDEELLTEVLKRLGPPEKLAASYAPPSYLIGPELYPTYLFVLKLVLAIALGSITIGLTIAAIVGAFSGNHSLLGGLATLAQGTTGLVGAGLQVVGIITLIFALVQRSKPEIKPTALPLEFDPRKLKTAPAQPPKTPGLTHAGLVFEMVFTIISIVIWNLYPRYVGLYIPDDSGWIFVPILTEAFFTYIPYMSVIWALEVALMGSVLAVGGWTRTTKWLQVALKVASITLLYFIFSGPDIVMVPASIAASDGTMSELPVQFRNWLNLNVRFSLGIAMIVVMIEALVAAIKLLRLKNR
jgi:hypothetical protein